MRDDRRLCFVDYVTQVKIGDLHIEVDTGGKSHELRGDKLLFGVESVIVTSYRGDECSFPKCWLSVITA